MDHLFGSRPRPFIAYLGRFHDWRDWERYQLKQEELLEKKNTDSSPSSSSSSTTLPPSQPEPILTRGRTTCTDHDQSITPRHSHEKT